ncbi:MAG: hypothetical protein VW397_07720 [Candidatus Margulisiibacteriota bacterium]
MGKYFKFQDITKTVDHTKKKTTPIKPDIISKSTTEGPLGLPKDNIQALQKLCKELLDEGKKVTISNLNHRNENDPLIQLMVTPAGYRLRLKRQTKQFDYIYEFNKNILILNKQHATRLDAERFRQFFDLIVSRLTKDQYDVIREL